MKIRRKSTPKNPKYIVEYEDNRKPKIKKNAPKIIMAGIKSTTIGEKARAIQQAYGKNVNNPKI